MISIGISITAAHASTLDLDFSYYNNIGSTASSDPGYVTGEIELTCTTSTKCTATAVTIDSLPSGFSISESLPFDTTITGDVGENSFTLSKTGSLSAYDYYAVISGTLNNPVIAINLSGGLGEVGGSPGGGTAGALSFEAVTPTPLPATWTMMIAGFVGLGFFAWRGSKNRSAAAFVAA
jgi:hypothetical protein